MRTVLLLLLTFSIQFLFESYSYAKVPQGFEDFAVEKKQHLFYTINDGSGIELLSFSSGERVKIDPSESERLYEFLKKEYVKEKVAKDIVQNLEAGVDGSKNCLGRKATCYPNKDGEDEIQFIIVDNSKSIRLLVPTAAMSTVEIEKKYIDEKVDVNALVLANHLSVGGGAETDSYASYNNKMTAGMFGGYLESDLNVNSENNSDYGNAYFDEFTYNYLVGENKVRVGYLSDNVERSWNGTSLLDADEQKTQLSAEFGTTGLLNYKNKKSSQRLYFFVPAAGRLRITQENGKSVLERNVSPGQQFVLYSELPKGIHHLTLSVFQGESELFHEVRKVYNNSDNAMNINQYDFQISAGTFLEQNIFSLENVEDNYDNEAFVDARVATKISDDLTLGIGVLNSKNSYYTKIATQYRVNNDIDFNALYGFFDNNSTYYQTSLSLYGVHVNWNKFEDRSSDYDKYGLANYLYGYGSTQDLTISYSHNLWNGNFYASYNFSENEGGKNYYLDDEDNALVKYGTAMLGYSFRGWLNSTIDTNVTYSRNKNIFDNQFSEVEFSLSISIPFSNQGYVSSSISASDQFSTKRASVGNSYAINNDLDIGTEVGIMHQSSENLESDRVSDISISSNYHDDRLAGSSYAYASSDGSYNVYGDISTTTLITNDSIYLTSKKSKSYLVVENDGELLTSETEVEGTSKSIVNLTKNGEQSSRMSLDSPSIIYGVESYKEYVVTLDESASDYENHGEKQVQASSYPGTVLKFSPDLRVTKSFISIFNDIDGKPIKSVECKGDGCVSVDELSDGVFKFRILSGLPFQLNSEMQRCVIPKLSNLERYNLGINFCMPEFSLDDGVEFAINAENKYVYYVGEFTDLSLVDKYKDEFKTNELVLITKLAGDRIFLFAETESKISSFDREKIDSLKTYAIESDSNDVYYATK